MTKNLVIVESPSKSHTIEKYLGKDYKVTASMGHIRDLATSGKYGLGVDTENDFKATYIPVDAKKKVLSQLKKEVKDADKIILATDPDREGEAISWHLKEALNIADKNYERVLFNEITKDKVLEAIANPRKIDNDLVLSQETRRILDRIIGFRLSKLMQSKTGGKSAGRVQSVALKLIVDREREIDAFVPVEYWTITAIFDEFEAKLYAFKNKDIEIPNEEVADKILAALSNEFKVVNVEKKLKAKKSKFPFITSTLQQDASNKLGFSSKKTMTVAQKLYEGKDLGSETTGLITYMRTDSTRLSDEFSKSAFAYIAKEYGKDYMGYVKKAKEKTNVQDAHEAIRPTSVNRTPQSIKEYLTADEYKLYSLIYYRSLASLMADAKVNATTIVLDNNSYQFKATGQTLVFDGYLKVYSDYESSEDKILPEMKKGEVKKTDTIEKNQHFTQPPARYTEARLVKELEDLGIGRPSTYANIIDTIKTREYVYLDDKKFRPAEIGYEITDRLQEGFKDIINVEYTSMMEKDLDEIAGGQINNVSFLSEFWNKFEPMVKTAFKEMEKKPPEEVGENCPECGHPLVKRKGKFGEFVACSNYPTCKYIKKEKKEEKIIAKCLKCDGNIVEKTTRKGKIFYGCSNYPKCKVATWDKPIMKECPECSEMLVEKDNNIKCSSCDYTEK